MLALVKQIVDWVRALLCRWGLVGACPQLPAHPSGRLAQISLGAGLVQPVLPPQVHPVIPRGHYPGGSGPGRGYSGHGPYIPRVAGSGSPLNQAGALRLLDDPAFTQAACCVNGTCATEDDFRVAYQGGEAQTEGQALATALLEVLNSDEDLSHVLALSSAGDRPSREAALGLLVAKVACTKFRCEELAAAATQGDPSAKEECRAALQACRAAPHLLENQVAERCLLDLLAMGGAARAAADVGEGFEGADAPYDPRDVSPGEEGEAA